MSESAFTRFIGGSPVAVLIKLVFVSLVVGALLAWLDLRPYELVEGLMRFARRLWALGFDAVREVADYIIAGAILVVPIWFLARLLGARRR